MSEHYRTKQGDVLDQLCYERYGNEHQVVSVLDANPGLADYPPTLPMGVSIYFPTIEKPSRRVELVRLWN